jgi:hypothetical protein
VVHVQPIGPQPWNKTKQLLQPKPRRRRLSKHLRTARHTSSDTRQLWARVLINEWSLSADPCRLPFSAASARHAAVELSGPIISICDKGQIQRHLRASRLLHSQSTLSWSALLALVELGAREWPPQRVPLEMEPLQRVPRAADA